MNNKGNIIFYKGEDGNIKINVIFEGETIWLSQKQIGEVFGTTKQNISLHLQNCFESGEISEKATVKNFLTVQKEGNREVKRDVNFYNLDAILSVGYRVNSVKATQFRIWSNNILKEYIIKGFTMDDERLKNGEHFGKDYFDELLARIREIRASERRFYQKITDIYATSDDYNGKAQISRDFFAEVQNKFLYAVCGKIAGELEYSRVNSEEKNMGLTSWKGQKTGGKIIKTDIIIGKNYLDEEEIETLNLLISGYLDFAELQVKKKNVMTMENWIKKTKNFLELNDMNILEGKGKIYKEQADEKAGTEYNKFRIEQDKKYLSDFDEFASQVNKKIIR